MTHLVLAFCSLRPSNMSADLHSIREFEYLVSLQQIRRVIPSCFHVKVMENTVRSYSGVGNLQLRSLLSEIGTIFVQENEGDVNKGVGELHMLSCACEGGLLDGYDMVVYLTARRFVTCPYVFERTDSSPHDAVVSNPDFVYLKDGTLEPVEKNGMYNDMFFAMRSKFMKEYAAYCRQNKDKMIAESINSESMLYRFVNEKGLSYTWLEHLGFIRNDWFRNKKIDDLGNYHVC